MTVRLTVAQALVRFLEAQHVERDGVENAFFAGCWGIFGHGNVAGVGQALLEREVAGDPSHLRYLQGRNEQAMVHAAVAYARQRDRLATMAVTASVGPGATNMVTGAALATINRLPVLLLPGDTFATKVANPVLQELEDPANGDISVNDAFRPVSAYFDRVHRPEQLAPALLHAMRVLTDPAATGAVTLALPQDVQAEAYDWPEELFAHRVWHVARPVPEPAALDRAVAAIRSASKPLIVAGGGVTYSRRQRRAARRSPRRPASRSPRRRPARARWRTTTRSRSARSAPPARPPPTRSPPRPTSSSASARATATSPPPHAPCSPRTTCGSSTSTCRRSTRTSSPRPASSPTPARACEPWPRRSRAGRSTPRHTGTGDAAGRRVGRDRAGRVRP